jgi:hypothetical protein
LGNLQAVFDGGLVETWRTERLKHKGMLDIRFVSSGRSDDL